MDVLIEETAEQVLVVAAAEAVEEPAEEEIEIEVELSDLEAEPEIDDTIYFSGDTTDAVGTTDEVVAVETGELPTPEVPESEADTIDFLDDIAEASACPPLPSREVMVLAYHYINPETGEYFYHHTEYAYDADGTFVVIFDYEGTNGAYEPPVYEGFTPVYVDQLL